MSVSTEKRKEVTRKWRRRRKQLVYLVQACTEKLAWRKGFIPRLKY